MAEPSQTKEPSDASGEVNGGSQEPEDWRVQAEMFKSEGDATASIESPSMSAEDGKS